MMYPAFLDSRSSLEISINCFINKFDCQFLFANGNSISLFRFLYPRNGPFTRTESITLFTTSTHFFPSEAETQEKYKREESIPTKSRSCLKKIHLLLAWKFPVL